jgi:uracil-DNA glycosylase
VSLHLANYWDFGSSWHGLDAEFCEHYPNNLIGRLDQFLSKELDSQGVFYPAPHEHIFRAFKLTPLNEVKVVIVGQDPYADGRATGLAFSVRRGEKLPQTLCNIYSALETDLGIPPAACGDLTSWAQQGVLLLNSVLTVRPGEANSHRKGGWWTRFTNRALRLIAQARPGAVFCLWGAQAEGKRKHIERSGGAHVLSASHPSPRTCRRKFRTYPSFVNCGHFKEANERLRQANEDPICWKIPRCSPSACAASSPCYE